MPDRKREELDETLWGSAVGSKKTKKTNGRKRSSGNKTETKKKKTTSDKENFLGFRPIFILLFLAVFLAAAIVGYFISGAVMGDYYAFGGQSEEAEPLAVESNMEASAHPINYWIPETDGLEKIF